VRWTEQLEYWEKERSRGLPLGLFSALRSLEGIAIAAGDRFECPSKFIDAQRLFYQPVDQVAPDVRPFV
jgi:hypothetical protein